MAPTLSNDPVEPTQEWKHVVSVLRALSESTDGRNTWEKKREAGSMWGRAAHIGAVSERVFHSTVSLNQRARENSSSQSFVFLNHTAWCVFPRRAVTWVYGHICAVWAEWNMSIPRPTGRPNVGNLPNVPCKAVWSVLQMVQVMWKTMSFRNWLVLGLYEGLVSLVIALYNYASRIRPQSDIFL